MIDKKPSPASWCGPNLVTTVKACQRCGEEHWQLTFEPLANPADEWTYWALCPRTKQPILLRWAPVGSGNPQPFWLSVSALADQELKQIWLSGGMEIDGEAEFVASDFRAALVAKSKEQMGATSTRSPTRSDGETS